MKLVYLSLIIWTLSVCSLLAQSPAIEWQQTIGGDGLDKVIAAVATTDNGFCIGGISISGVSGDKTTAPFGDIDSWIIQTDSNGLIEWQIALGGSEGDYITSIAIDKDGGYIVGLNSSSPVSGNKTVPPVGVFDYWIVKINAEGVILWQQVIGGAGPDYLSKIIPAPAGGYLALGRSSSGVSGHKSEPSRGGSDYWLLRLDSLGNTIYDRTIGGSGVEYAVDLIPTPDGGCRIGGYSNSPPSADKTALHYGQMDYWVLGLNSLGAINMQASFGGLQDDNLTCMLPLPGNRTLLAGASNSAASGNKTTIARGGFDFWWVVIEGDGATIQQSSIGGTASEFPTAVLLAEDNTLYMAGYSNSPASGEKSVDSYAGSYDYWLVHTAIDGTVHEQFNIGSTGSELLATALLQNSGILLAGYSDGPANGDKTDPPDGDDDYWLVYLNLNPDACTDPPSTPFTGSIEPTTMQLLWEDYSGAESYRVQLKSTDGAYGDIYATLTNEIFIDELIPGTSYIARVRAKCGPGEWSPWSTALLFATPARWRSTTEQGVVLFPNPAQHQLQVLWPAYWSTVDVLLYTGSGALAGSWHNLMGNVLELSVNQPGTYYLIIRHAGGVVQQQLVVTG
jgi:hypothetical protein